MPLSLIDEQEKLSVVGTNQVADLSFAPVGGLVMLVVNGYTFTPQDGSFQMNGAVVNWLSTVYGINPGDTVIAVYSHMG